MIILHKKGDMQAIKNDRSNQSTFPHAQIVHRSNQSTFPHAQIVHRPNQSTFPHAQIVYTDITKMNGKDSG